MVEVAGYKFNNRHDAEIMAALADGETPADIAAREGMSVQAIYERRRRFEKATGLKLKRASKRGRPILSAA